MAIRSISGGTGKVRHPGRIVGGTGGSGPPVDDFTVSLLHFTGTNGGTTFTDECGHVWTRGGNGSQPSTTTDQFQFSPSSGQFNGTSNPGDLSSYISTPVNDDFQFGNGDFTIEGWCRKTGLDNVPFLWSPNVIAGTNYCAWGFSGENGTPNFNVRFLSSSNGTSADLVNNDVVGVVDVNSWFAWSVSRVGTNMYVFINGVLGHTANVGTTSLFPLNGPIYLGGNFIANNRSWGGQIDEVRFTKGLGRYTSNYIPTGPFPNP